MPRPLRFGIDCVREALRGSALYWGAMALLAMGVLVGLQAYAVQLDQGLIVTGMTDQVTWGLYIGNFTYLVGMAAAAVMVIVPAHIFHHRGAQHLTLIAEGVAVSACVMALLFVVVDLGHPERFVFLLPLVGSLNLPMSVLAWDVLVVPGYLSLNLAVPAFVLYRRYARRPVDEAKLLPVVLITVFWAIALHTVTAFLFSAHSARPFWHSALLAPRFLGSAFCSGPALLLLFLLTLRWLGKLDVPIEGMRLLALVVAVALQVNLIMLLAEVFTELYRPGEHEASARYLFFGLGEADALVPWIRAAVAMELVAVVLLMYRRSREHPVLLAVACAFTAVGVWIEKGMGLIIPGFVPTALGEVAQYQFTSIELRVSMGIWALGVMLLLVLAKVSLAIDRGDLTAPARG